MDRQWKSVVLLGKYKEECIALAVLVMAYIFCCKKTHKIPAYYLFSFQK